MTVTAFIRHSVNDYDAWRSVYDGLGDLQTGNGVTAQSVHRLVGNGNDVTVVHQFDTLESAEAFLGSNELQAAMRTGGVEGPPRIEICQDA